MEISANNNTPLKKPKLLRGVPANTEQFVFVDSATNKPIDGSSLSLLIVDDAVPMLASMMNEVADAMDTISANTPTTPDAVEEPKAPKTPTIDPKELLNSNPNSGKYATFTHRESANYLGLKSAIKKVFSNFKFSKNQFKWQMETLSKLKEQKRRQAESREVFELPKYTEEMSEKQGTSVPQEYDEVYDVPSFNPVYNPIHKDIPTIQRPEPVVEPAPVPAPAPAPVAPTPAPVPEPAPEPEKEPEVQKPQRINYDGIDSKFSDAPELNVKGEIETNLNMTDEEREKRRLEEEEKNKTVINDETNPIPDVHLDLEKLDKDLVIFEKPKAVDMGMNSDANNGEIVMPEDKIQPFAPKDNSVFTPEFNDEYLQHGDNGESFQSVYGDDVKRSVSIMNTETGEKQVIIDLTKEREENQNPDENVEAQAEGQDIIEDGTHPQSEIQKGKKTYKLKKYKKDIIPEDTKSGRGVAWLAYILFFIPLLFKGNNTFVRHHANEGLELNIMEIVAAGLILPYFLIESTTATMTYVLMAMAFGGLLLAICLVIAMLMSMIFAMCGLTSNLPFFWGFRFIPVARKKKVRKAEAEA